MTFYRSIGTASLVAVMAAGLSGCFDIVEKVSVDRHGAGHYHIALTAAGIVGEGLKNAEIVDTVHNRARLATAESQGKVTRTADVDFDALSDLTLSSQTIRLTVTHRDFFGLGPSHVAFHAIARVDRARENRAAGAGDLGEQIAQSILGDHSYTFSVTVPGSVERAAPIVVDGRNFAPDVTGNFYHGHCVTWRLPLASIVDAKALDFEVDFAAYGFFHDAQTKMSD